MIRVAGVQYDHPLPGDILMLDKESGRPALVVSVSSKVGYGQIKIGFLIMGQLRWTSGDCWDYITSENCYIIR